MNQKVKSDVDPELSVMKPENIKFLIRSNGATLKDVADVVGVSPTAVSSVIKGSSKSRRIAQTIAIFLDRDIDQLWPGMYPASYTRRGMAAPRLLEAFAKLQAREARAGHEAVAGAV